MIAYVNVNEEGEDYDSHDTVEAALRVQALFPNDTIEVRDQPPAGLQSIVITREQLESWAGCPLTDAQVARLEECIPNSSIPEAIATIVDSLQPAEPAGEWGHAAAMAYMERGYHDELPADAGPVGQADPPG